MRFFIAGNGAVLVIRPHAVAQRGSQTICANASARQRTFLVQSEKSNVGPGRYLRALEGYLVRSRRAEDVWSLSAANAARGGPGRAAQAAAVGGDILVESLFWAPGVTLEAGAAAVQGVGHVVGALGSVSVDGAASAAQGAAEVVGGAAFSAPSWTSSARSSTASALSTTCASRPPARRSTPRAAAAAHRSGRGSQVAQVPSARAPPR